MPKVFFYGNALPTTKDNVNLTMEYISNTAKFRSFVKLKCQGNSSMGYAKKNFTINMYSDEARKTKLKKDFKGWGAQSKFCLKANYVDTTHTRNISGARISYDMVASRPDSEFKQQLLTAPRNGAIDGFPIKLYFNGEFYGIYTWNIPKDGWMFNMDKTNPNHMVLCAEQNNNGSTVNDNVLRCEFRKEWDGSDGTSWSIEFGTYSDALKNSFNRCVNFVMTATDAEFKANIGDYFDLYSLLDYYCFSYLVAHIDGLAKNLLMATYDGVIWGACLYDMDSIYGADWQGTQFKATNIQCPEQYQETNSLLWQRIESCFPVELYARYLELRQGALSLSNIIKHVEEIYDVIPDRVFVDEKAKWTSLPGVSVNTMTRFRNYMRDRAVYVDAQMLEIGTKVPCTGIVLGADTLSFTTTDPQTLSVVVSPENCTDTVTWSVSPSGIVTVNNGVVTPVSNGECTITATCGSYSDTCSVTVSLPVVECTGISLDKTELALGRVSSDASDAEVNLLDGAEWSNGALDIINGTIRANNTDKYTQINISTPGKYTLSSTVGYTYKKIALYDTNGAFMCGVGNEENTNNCVINVTKPCVAKIGAYPNGIAWDGSALSLTRSKINENITNSDATYTLTSSDINVRYTGSNYVYAEVFLDKLYNDLVIVEIDGSICGTVKKNVVVRDEGHLNTLVTSKNLGYINTYEYNSKTFLNVVFPITYGTTADAILSSMTSTTITLNPTDELAKIEASATTQILSARLTATVSPTNCTQPVVWSVSPEGIATVNNGVVTAIANGEATVTATCGSYSDTCAVTVSGMSEYTDISYIESTGTQYINTRIVPTASTKIELVAEMSASERYDHIFGSDNFMKAQWMDETGTGIYATKKNGQNQITGLTLGKHTYVMDMTDTANVITIDGTKYGNIIGQVESTTNPLLLLCGYKNDGTIETELCGIGKIYSCKIYHEDTLVANMKPILTNGGTYGLLDTVNNTFYASEAGSFTGGNTPSGGDTDIYTTAEYAITEPRTFNGTSDYIDTGIKLFDTAKTFTIFIDYTSTANYETQVVVFHCIHEVSPWRGLCLMKGVNSNTYFIGGQAGNQASYNTNMPATGKYLISFVDGVINEIVTVNNSGDLVYSATDIGANNPYVQISENLLIGCYQDASGTKGRYWSGTINKFGVWYKQLTEVEINQVFGKNGGDSDVDSNYLANASWQVGTLDITNNATVSGSVDTSSAENRYTSVQIPAGKYALRSSNATWKKFRLSDSNGNVLYYYGGENTSYDIFIDTTISDDATFTLDVSYYRSNDTIEVPSLVTTDRTNITTITLDGSLTYGIPVWDTNPSGQNGQVNVEYAVSGLTSMPMSYKLEGYTYNNGLSNAESIGLAKQYNLGYWNGSVYLRFTLDMAETGVTNDVESITNYLSNHPLTFKYVR